MQGRSISAQALDLLLAYGTEEKAFGCRLTIRFDRDTRAELEAEYPHLRGQFFIKAVLEADVVVTACYDDRHHRDRRNRDRRLSK
ncbi:hypothetical protein [Loktanella salsilacus]|uniref:hypothetical protein n=1 Tax=Loktanella salsilacus TaxID=195913 RepID=UPI0037350CF2